MAWEVFTGFQSTNIATLRYDEDRSILEVGFLHGGIYRSILMFPAPFGQTLKLRLRKANF